MILHVDTGQTFSAHVSGGETQPAKISIHPTIPVHVDATATPPYSAHIAGGGAVGMSAAAPIAVRPTSGTPYGGRYVVTPSEETQTLRTANTVMAHDVVVEPIPSDYGRLAWNGHILTVY